jgi:putative membrane protein
MYWDHMNSSGWQMMVFWLLIWIVFLGMIAWSVVQWTRNNSQASAPSRPPSKSARELLNDRLARGEIDLDEYEQRLKALDRNTPVDGV